MTEQNIFAALKAEMAHRALRAYGQPLDICADSNIEFLIDLLAQNLLVIRLVLETMEESNEKEIAKCAVENLVNLPAELVLHIKRNGE